MTHDDVEFHYYEYLYGKGYSSPDALRGVLRVYLPFLEGRRHVLDVGCGRGEFLELLEGAGHVATGVDCDPAMVAACRSKRLTVVEGDALEWLPHQTERFDAVVSSNVVEHLTPAQVGALLRSAYAALRPGGRLLVATPNPEAIIVHLYEFWRDPTHVRLYNHQLLEFFLSAAGFTEIASHQNDAARWEDLDALTQSPKQEVYRVEPEPCQPMGADRDTSPGPGSVTNPFWARLLRPVTEPIRRELDAERARLDESRARLEAAERQIRQVTEVVRFLFPSRETFVCGTRPASPEEPAATAGRGGSS